MNEQMAYSFYETQSDDDRVNKRLRDILTNIIMDERQISEKSFSEVDQISKEVKDFCDSKPIIYTKARLYDQAKKRLQFLAEKIYERYFKT
ncbi:MAG: hypothetical protein GYA51_07035 [Candidatus Methanofastidiosa archaeon]|nr:hypothetical protein [Candidatus Methanofastidiosa archaeon]